MKLKEFTQFCERAIGREHSAVQVSSPISERGKFRTEWRIEKYKDRIAFLNGKPYAVEKSVGNLLLNEGITELLKLLIGGTATPFNNANAYIGVGDGTTTAVPTQTGLQGINKFYKIVDSGYPQVSGQTVIFKATFESGEATFDWQEFTISNGPNDSAINLNRKVEDHGRKGANDVWAITLSITIS